MQTEYVGFWPLRDPDIGADGHHVPCIVPQVLAGANVALVSSI